MRESPVSCPVPRHFIQPILFLVTFICFVSGDPGQYLEGGVYLVYVGVEKGKEREARGGWQNNF